MPHPIGPTSLDVPAWVQAIGSVAAILVAIYISVRDSRAEKRAAMEAKQDILTREIAERARFFQMVALQLHECVTVLEEIGKEETRYQNEVDDRPSLRWRSWAELHVERFRALCVDRLQRLEDLPLTAWPDIESGIVFGDAVRFWKPTFKDILDAVHSPPPETDDDDRDHFLGGLNEVTYLADFFLVPFERFLAIRDHETARARASGIDLRYGGRETPDQLVRAAAEERRGFSERRDPKGAFMSEYQTSLRLRESIRVDAQ